MKRSAVAITVPILAGACAAAEHQSVLDPAGSQAASIYNLWTYMWITAGIVYLAVIAVLVLVIRRGGEDDAERRSPAREHQARRAIQGGIGVTLGILLVTLAWDFATGRGIMHHDPRAVMTIQVTGHLWWWEVVYEDSVPQQRVALANEIHLPAGQLTRIRLTSNDVIHSLWAPNLGGKKDLIPGHDNDIWLRGDREGVYRAQCAEFCGLQHAKMALFVVVESPQRFAEWMAQQRVPAPATTDSFLTRGRQIVEYGPCALCHTVSGTRAAGRVGPDLTHVASRLSIAAGTLHNTRGNLAGWIADPQTIKPGAGMPPQPLTGTDLRAVVAYLETLK